MRLFRRLTLLVEAAAAENGVKFGTGRFSFSTSPKPPPPPPPPELEAAQAWWTQRQIPFWPRMLGFAGLIPFYALPAASHMDHPMIPPWLKRNAESLHIMYGASITSFLGAVSWGTAIAGVRAPMLMNERFALGVIPSLMAFPLPALPTDTSNFLMVGSLMTAFYIDWHFFMQRTLPVWYIRLRVMLTLGATASYALAETLRRK